MNPARLSTKRLADASSRYDRLVASGETGANAMRMAICALSGEQVEAATVVLPPEVTPIVQAYCKWVAGERWRPVYAELTTGTSRTHYYSGLRDEIGWVLHLHGYHARVIALALGRDRTSIIDGRQRFEKRLGTDEILRARIARVMGARAEGRAA